MTRPPSKPVRPSPPPLSQIEQAGQDAAREMAQAFVDKALKNGGVIDEADFERAGPDVRRLALDLMSSMASTEAEIPSHSPLVSSHQESVASGQRVDENWADLRYPALEILANPFLYGFVMAAFVGPVLIWLVHYFGL